MPIEPESIEIGHCYLSSKGFVRRVLQVLGDGKLLVEVRKGTSRQWHSDMVTARFFASSTERRVPCDWTPDKGTKDQ